MNPGHPFCTIFVNMLQDRPKELKVETSKMYSEFGRMCSFQLHYVLVQDSLDNPVAYLVHFTVVYPKESELNSVENK